MGPRSGCLDHQHHPGFVAAFAYDLFCLFGPVRACFGGFLLFHFNFQGERACCILYSVYKRGWGGLSLSALGFSSLRKSLNEEEGRWRSTSTPPSIGLSMIRHSHRSMGSAVISGREAPQAEGATRGDHLPIPPILGTCGRSPFLNPHTNGGFLRLPAFSSFPRKGPLSFFIPSRKREREIQGVARNVTPAGL